MTNQDRTAWTAIGSRQAALLGVAGTAALASGIVGIAMVAFLLGMFAAFAVGATSTALTLGWINDALTIVVYGLALPVIVALHVILRPTGPGRSLLLAVLGAGGAVATMVLQLLLVSGALAFRDQVGMVSVALLVVGAWMIGTGVLARSIGFLPNGLRNGILGAIYLGYPVWAFDVGRRLRAAAQS